MYKWDGYSVCGLLHGLSSNQCFIQASYVARVKHTPNCIMDSVCHTPIPQIEEVDLCYAVLTLPKLTYQLKEIF